MCHLGACRRHGTCRQGRFTIQDTGPPSSPAFATLPEATVSRNRGGRDHPPPKAGGGSAALNVRAPCSQVDARTIEKYEKEAKEKNRDSWFLAFIMDTNEEERAKGKTVEVRYEIFADDPRGQ